jgi:hypothetical protein
METLRDHKLRENPDETLKRAKRDGTFDAIRKYRHRAASTLMKRAREKGEVTAQQYVDIQFKIWSVVHGRWPVPDDAEVMHSLVAWLRTKEYGQRYLGVDEQGRSVIIPADAEKRFSKLPAMDANSEVTVQWALDNLDNPRADPLKAPSRGAWTLLGWAKGNRDGFFKDFYKPMMAAQKKEKTQSEVEADALEKLARQDLREMLKAAVGKSKAVA